MTGVGLLLSCAALPRLLAALGPLRLMGAGLLATAGVLVLFPAFESVAAWFVLRIALGFCLNATFVVGEAWLNAIAGQETRGRMLGLYCTVNAGGCSGLRSSR